jgi:acyl carrier protein
VISFARGKVTDWPDQWLVPFLWVIGRKMPDISEIRNRIREFVVRQFPQARRRAFVDDEALLGSGIIDSMGILDLVGFLETEFSITVADEELLQENFQTIECTASFVEAKVQGPAVSSGKRLRTA